jgi:hypothetical protein
MLTILNVFIYHIEKSIREMENNLVAHWEETKSNLAC